MAFTLAQMLELDLVRQRGQMSRFCLDQMVTNKITAMCMTPRNFQEERGLSIIH